MTGRTCLVAIAVMSLAVAGGCGGSSDPYSLEATRDCLSRNGDVSFPADQSADLIADDAPAGKLVVDFSGDSANSATIAFGRTSGDAKRMKSAYKVFADAFEAPLDDVFFLDRNVAYVFDNTPTQDEEKAISDCLT